MDSECMKCQCGFTEPPSTKEKLINLLGFSFGADATLETLRNGLVTIINEMGPGEL